MKKNTFLLSSLLLSFTAQADNITFLDPHVKSVCVEKWDTNGDGELSMEEAAAVTNLNTVFSFDGTMASFPELQYFTGLTSIATYDFYSCKNLTTIVLPSQISSIGSSAFFGCYRLQEIVIPSAVKKINEYAFNGCTGLQSVTFQEGLTTIGEYAFSACSALQGIAVPASVTSIATSAFWSCPGLNTITVDADNTVYDSREDCNGLIQTSTNTLVLGTVNTVFPESVTAIGSSAFYGNSRLQTINITGGVQSIGASAFSGCTALTTVILAPTVTTIGSSAFSGCKKLTAIHLPIGLKTIGSGAFKTCTSLKKILIPATVTNISNNAFTECSKMLKVAMMNATPITINNTVFPNYKNSTLYVPKGSLEAYQNAKYWKDFKNIVEFDDNTLTAAVEPEIMEAGNTANIVVSLANDDFFDYHSLQMDITLPVGFSINADATTLSDRCTGMSVAVEPLENNVYRLICSSESTAITGTEGALLTISLQAASNVATGDYQGAAENSVLTDEYGTPSSLTDAEFTWSVVAYYLGDVNHDGIVNITDVVMCVDFVLGDYTNSFFEDRADMNGDGIVNITDVVIMVDTVLGAIPLTY